MLFSHPQVAELMSSAFECAWESVRPVPRVSIDFGNGRTLERTLHGNVVTYFCTSRGQVCDLLPGLVDAQEYRRRLDQALRLHRASQRFGLIPPLAQGVFTLGGVTQAASRAPDEDLDSTRLRLLSDWHRALIGLQEGDVPLSRDPIRVFDGSKMRVERRLDESLLPPLAAHDAESLRRDTLHNRVHRYPLASQLWFEHPLAYPAEITGEVYRRILGVDLDDPYLGLAPEVLGGEPGRH